MTAIRARLDRAAAAREAARAKLSPMEQDLLWLLNFEQPDMMLVRDGGWIPISLEKRHFAPGRFGRGYYFELPQCNYLPPAMADVETDISGFVKHAHAVLESLPAETAFGQRVLSVSCKGAGAGFATVPVEVEVLRYGAGHQPTVTLLASCYLKGPQDTKVRLQLQFAPAELIDPKTKQPAADRKADTSEPLEVTLTGTWQRVACTATGDRRLSVRTATLSVALAGDREAQLLADGLQFESCLYYPHQRLQPTTWTPGGTERPRHGPELLHTEHAAGLPPHRGHGGLLDPDASFGLQPQRPGGDRLVWLPARLDRSAVGSEHLHRSRGSKRERRGQGHPSLHRQPSAPWPPMASGTTSRWSGTSRRPSSTGTASR